MSNDLGREAVSRPSLQLPLTGYAMPEHVAKARAAGSTTTSRRAWTGSQRASQRVAKRLKERRGARLGRVALKGRLARSAWLAGQTMARWTCAGAAHAARKP